MCLGAHPRVVRVERRINLRSDRAPLALVARATYLSKGAKYLVPIVSADSYPEAVLTTLVYVYGFGFDDRVHACRPLSYTRTPSDENVASSVRPAPA